MSISPVRFEYQADAFLTALERERYLQRAGLQAVPDLQRVYDDHPDVADPAMLERLRDEPLPVGSERLEAFVTLNRLDRAVIPIDMRLAAGQANAEVEWLGTRLPYRRAALLRELQPDRDDRRRLDAIVREETARLNPLRQERLARLQSASADLGHESPLELWDDLHGLGLDDLAEAAQRLLGDTAAAYEQALGDLVAQHQLDGGDLDRLDLAWMIRAAELDRLLPRLGAEPTAYAAFAALDLRLDDQPSLRIDAAPRPHKVAEPFCAELEVPDDVRAVVQPRGGWLDRADLLHQLGRAASAALVDRTQPLAYRRFGDAAVAEGYGLLFRWRMADPAWLRWRLELDDPRDVARFVSFARLHSLRVAALELAYEQELWRSEEPAAVAERHAELFTEGLGARHEPPELLVALATPPIAARRLRGEMVEAGLRHFLAAEFDEEWFRSARAGRFLLDRWREGRRYGAAELVQNLGSGDLDLAAISAELELALSA
jgi:hypothetical protein